MPVHARDCRVAVSTTAPPTDESQGVKEIERLYLDMIAAARDYIYVENQYFTSEVIGEALKRSLAAPRGPQVIVLTRHDGWSPVDEPVQLAAA